MNYLPVPINRPPRLLHYSQKPTLMRPVVTTLQRNPYGDLDGMKPTGLWVSVEGEYDWKWWCLAEEFQLENLRHVHEVILRPSAKVLRVSTIAELDAFDAKYKASTSAAAMLDAGLPAPKARGLLSLGEQLLSRTLGINWQRVARDYAGIIIAPYQWDRRLGHMLWYYGWDCASGCIWDADAIAQVRLLKENVINESAIRRNIHQRMKYAPRKFKKVHKRLKTWMAERRS